MTRINTNKGIVTLELLIAFAIGITLLTSAVVVSFGGQTASMDTRLTGSGISKAVTHLASTSAALASANLWSTFSDGLFQEDESADPDDAFYDRFRTIDTVFDCVKYIGSDTDWKSEKGRSQSVGLGSLVANIAAAKALAGACSPIPSGNWNNPQTYGSSPPNTVDGQGTGIDVAPIKDVGLHTFLTTFNSDAKKADLWSFDVTNPKTPILRDSIDIASSSNAVDVAHDYPLNRDYAFVASYSESKTGTCPAGITHNPYRDQLQVVDVTVPSAMSLEKSISLSTVDPCSEFPGGNTVHYYNRRVYVGTKRVIGAELTIFDASNPVNPVEIGAIEVNRNVNAIVVRNNLAYVATGSGVAYNNPLKIYNVDTTSPNFGDEVGSFVTHIVAGPRDIEGRSLYIVGNTLYLGRDNGNVASGGNPEEPDFYIIDVTNPASPTAIGSKVMDIKNNTAVTGISANGPLAFLSTTDSNSEFFVLYVSDPSQITAVSKCIPYNYSQDTQGLIYYDDYVYVVDRSQAGLRVIYGSPIICPKK